MVLFELPQNIHDSSDIAIITKNVTTNTNAKVNDIIIRVYLLNVVGKVKVWLIPIPRILKVL